MVAVILRRAQQPGEGPVTGLVSSSYEEPPRPLAITGVTLIDGVGRPPLANATVVIDGERVARIGPTAETPAPERRADHRRPWPLRHSRPRRHARPRARADRFHRAGGTVLAGTDCPNVAIVSGFSLHRELELLVRAGLSTMDALRAATSGPAARLDRAREFGTIAPGLSADLVLLGADPLADIRNVRRIERVAARGRVYESETLQRAGAV